MEDLQLNSRNDLQDRLFNFVVIAVTEKADEWKKMGQESLELMKILGRIYSKSSAKR